MKAKYQLVFFVSLSALLLSSAFFLPNFFAWTIFIFLIPLYYAVFKFPVALNYKYGLLWGILFYATHSSGVALLCIEHGSGFLKYIAGLFIIFYFSLYAVLWFGVTRFCILRLGETALSSAVCWFISTFVFFYVYKYYSWWVFGIYHNGYCFGSPLLPMAEYPWLLRTLPVIGESGLISLLLICQLAMAALLVKKKFQYSMGLFVLLPFFWGFIKPVNFTVPEYVQTLGYIKPPAATGSLYSIEKAMSIDFQIDALMNEYPTIKNILMPEASLSISINCYPELIELLTEHTHNKDINLFIGAYRAIEEKRHNSLYLIRGGEIKSCYDKKLRMPFMEYVPFPWNYFSVCKNLFLKEWDGFETSQELVQELPVNQDLSFVPCICSEFFFGTDELFNTPSAAPILVITKENWFSADYLRHLMFLYARYKSIQYKRDLIFVGHTQACWINSKNGELIHLQC